MANEKNAIIVSPIIRVTRWAFEKPDEQRQLPNGQTVGDDKFKVVGFFDPTTAEGAAFVKKVTDFLGSPKPKAALDQTLPVHDDLPRKIEGLPGGWMRLSAKTKYGPVEVIDRAGNVVRNPDRTIYAGACMRVAVSFFLFDDPRLRGAKNISFALKTAILLDGGEPLSIGGPRIDPRDVFAAEIMTSIDPLGEL